jgi:hypothetical protein
MALGIKQVIQLAREQFKQLLPDLDIQATDIRLEEIEREGDNWAITFSVPNPAFENESVLKGIRSARTEARIAKVIVVDGSEGQFLALRERAA